MPFVDTDEVAAAAAGKSVADIFLDDGEERFRELERAAVVSTAGVATRDRVVALGGGAVLNPETRARSRGPSRRRAERRPHARREAGRPGA